MAIITDPDDLNQNTEITIDTSAKTIELTVTGNLNDGVTGQAFYSFLKEEWRNTSLIQYDPPFNQMITSEQFEFINGWTPANDTTRNLLKTVGWREINASGVLEREYMNVINLGDIESTNTAYYAFSSDTAKTDFSFTGEINQAIQTYGDSSNGNFDKRSDSLTIYIRSQGNTYDSATSGSIGLSSLNYKTNRFPLSEGLDSKISASDSDIQNNTPYTGMSITYGAVTRTIGSSTYNFDIVIDGNNGTTQQIYEFVQYNLRQSTDIDDGAGTQVGQLANDLLKFEGDTLKTTTGVVIDNFQASDRNNLVFTDTTNTERTYPFLATGTLLFNANLVNDSDAIYKMFFTSGYGTSSAIIVDDNSGTDISGNVGGASSIDFTFDYDGNTQGGRTSGTDAAVKVVAIGLDKAQYVIADATLTRSTGQNISLVSPFERNYSNT
tara:strand:- start:15243 stop:16556 length:1314 start_codon:yes stop_codon:yes gene_type:complete